MTLSDHLTGFLTSPLLSHSDLKECLLFLYVACIDCFRSVW